MAKLNRSSMSIEEVVKNYYDTKEKFDSLTKRFNSIKKEFYSKMNEEMKDEKKLNVEYFAESYEVTKVQKNNIEFDIGKLERSLNKSQLKQIIRKQAVVVDTDKLIEYFKELGADPKRVKELIIVTKKVDSDEINRLSEIGEINDKLIVEAANITISSQYYTVKKL